MTIDTRSTRTQLIRSVDKWVLVAGFGTLAILIFAASRANIVADSVDYYAILQRLTPADEKPIVRNLHFMEQRSPGYPMAALSQYGLIALVVEPLVSTEQVIETVSSSPSGFPRPTDRSTPGLAGSPSSPPAPVPAGSEFMLIPPRPLLLKDVPFKDFYIPREDSWFQWKLVLALALTSYLFFFAGMAAGGRALRVCFASLPGYCLVVIIVFTSPVFLRDVIERPLYATLAAYGAASFFALFFLQGHARQRTRDVLLAGFFLGFLVVTRLETVVFAGALALLLLIRREWRLVVPLVLGAAWALPVWALYNLTQFGTPVHLGILRGDINRLTINVGFIVENLVHPSSGILFWSPLITLGILAMLLSRSIPLRLIGVSSLVLLGIYLIRVPVMYERVGGELINIGGILVTSPSTPAVMRELVRSDINRYIIVLAPFAALGLRDWMGRAVDWRMSRVNRKVTTLHAMQRTKVFEIRETK